MGSPTGHCPSLREAVRSVKNVRRCSERVDRLRSAEEERFELSVFKCGTLQPTETNEMHAANRRLAWAASCSTKTNEEQLAGCKPRLDTKVDTTWFLRSRMPSGSSGGRLAAPALAPFASPPWS